jgi:hypothetical protein
VLSAGGLGGKSLSGGGFCGVTGTAGACSGGVPQRKSISLLESLSSFITDTARTTA